MVPTWLSQQQHWQPSVPILNTYPSLRLDGSLWTWCGNRDFDRIGAPLSHNKTILRVSPLKSLPSNTETQLQTHVLRNLSILLACTAHGDAWVDGMLSHYQNDCTKCGSADISWYSDLLEAGWSTDWITVGGNSPTVETSPGSLAVQWIPDLLHGGKMAEAWSWPSTLPSAEVQERAELYLYSPCGPTWPILGWNVMTTWNLCCITFSYTYSTHA